ncbi:L-threonylcarbamoyladenylate synthase [Methylocucumis oryzae]|uniref:Threonylcarbamoyl-AMP synthase n=1 Tax=Methylocucumis oryzae TaxID=1632867 RepID=A0A0F3IFK9_9GAMM|nr:L-threonylcarbamoyladenylate synthase [Methylocucumis oryzae]KJV05575.1 translation factor Sua5 [Methylocucumis oryzae]
MQIVDAAVEAAISAAVTALKAGQLVAFPTETVYGLGADASNPEAVKRIFQAKGRPSEHPLIVHIGQLSELYDWALTVPDMALRLAEAFWPGPLAMILPKRDNVPNEVTGGQTTVGLRMPNHPVALRLLHAFGAGIAAPSANRFCRISPTRAAHVAEELGASVELILDGGACTVGVESTIIDLSSQQPRLLRPGQLAVDAIEAVLGCRLILPNVDSYNEMRAPGLLALHYAPNTRALLCPSNELNALLVHLKAQGQRIGVMSLATTRVDAIYDEIIPMPVKADDYARELYTSLRSLDNNQLDLIIIEQPPTSVEWMAVNDRLGKAVGSE